MIYAALEQDTEKYKTGNNYEHSIEDQQYTNTYGCI